MTVSATKEAFTPQFSVSPRLVIVLSGKRKSGKDFIAEKLRHYFSDDSNFELKHEHECKNDGELETTTPSLRAVIIRVSAPLKERFAVEHQLDFQKLLDSSEYKERYRKGLSRA